MVLVPNDRYSNKEYTGKKIRSFGCLDIFLCNLELHRIKELASRDSEKNKNRPN
jgi:hypothetical protein